MLRILWAVLAVAVACGGPDFKSTDDSAGDAGDGGSSSGKGGTTSGNAGEDGSAAEGQEDAGSGGATASSGGRSSRGGTSASTGGSSDSAGESGGDGEGGTRTGSGGRGADGGTGGSDPGSGGTGGSRAGSGGDGGTGGSAGDTGGSAGSGANGGTAANGGIGGGAANGGIGGGPVDLCPTAFTVGSDGYTWAPAVGQCWSGYAFTGGDADSYWTPEDFTDCGAGCQLRMTGQLNASSASVVFVGFNLNQGAASPTKGSVTPAGTGVSVKYFASGKLGHLRVEIAGGSARYCAEVPTSTPSGGTTVNLNYATFNTKCWDPSSGTAYAKQAIDQLILLAPGDSNYHDYVLRLHNVAEF
ncbi:MAG TPA: hypothetical protein VGK73_38935 [Polyangiaceae bacterium]